MHGLLRTRRLRFFAVVLPVLGLMTMAACNPPPPPDPSGALEVCKSGANGMTGTPFQFKIDSSSPITVNGGACSGLIHVSSTSGTHTVTETPAPGTSLVAVDVVNGEPSSRSGNTETVTVNNDGTAANETRVTFTNTGPGPGVLKVCKQSPDPTLQNMGFSFTENGGPAFTVAAGPVGSPNCDGGTTYQNGTKVNVHELIPTNTFVSAIAVSDGRGSNTSLTTGDVTATVGSGTTIVTYTDRVVPIPQTGFIEICKRAGDRFVTGTFNYTITAPGQTLTTSAIAGQCSGPLQVNAGNVRVDEAANAPFSTSGFATVPPDRLVSQNATNQTATVVVPVSATSNNETLVNVTNVTAQGLVKVCKTLTADSGALANTAFVFNVTDAAGGEQVSIVVGAAPGTQCKFLSTSLPVGSAVSATEQVPLNANFVPTAGTGVSTTVQSGVNVLSVTNAATGWLEVCKQTNDGTTRTFSFSITGTVNAGDASQTVQNGFCSPAIRVFAGSQTVTEADPGPNYQFDHATAVHVDDQTDALKSSDLTARSATIDVKAGGTPANETKVRMFNKVRLGFVKLCKAPNAALGSDKFDFTLSINGGSPFSGATLTQNQCVDLFAGSGVPVVQPNGNATTVQITESDAITSPPQVTHTTSIVVAGAGSGTGDNATRQVTVTLGIGQTIVTYANAPGPLGS